jgi:hypothetical protein
LPAALPSGGAAPALPTVTLDDGAAALAVLVASGTVTGTVAPGPTSGTLVLVTALGTLPLSSDVVLPQGAQLTLQASSTPGQAIVIAIDGMPIGALTSSGGAGLPPSPISAPLPVPPTPPALVDLGARLTATVISAPPASGIASALLPAANVVAGAPLPPAPSTELPALAPTIPAPPATPAAAPTSPQAAPPVSQTTLAQAIPIPAKSSDTPVPPSSLAAAPAPATGAITQPAASSNAVVSGAPTTAAGAAASSGTPENQPVSDRVVPALPTAPATAGTATRLQTSGLFGGTGISRLLSTLATAFPPADPPPPEAEPRLPAPGASLALRVVAVQLAAPQRGAAPAPSTAATVIPGVIRATAPDAAIVATPGSTLRLTSAPPLPVGTRIALELLPSLPATARLIRAPVEEAAAATSPAPPSAVPSSDADASAPEGPTSATPGTAKPPNAASQGSAGAPPASTASPATSRPTAADTPVVRVTIAPAPAIAGAQASPALVGRVLADPRTTASAASLVETPLGLLAVTPRLAVPAGSLLLLELPDGLPATLDPLPRARPGAGGAKDWPALQATLTALDHAAPNLSAQLRADLSSGGGETLAGALLYLVATLRGSDNVAWPGAAIEHALLEAGHGDLAKRLGEEIGALRSLADAPATAPWQVFILPIVDGGQVRPLRLYLKRRDEAGRRRKGEDENARFVLEFELSRFGTMQLDGFIRRHRFDLALRSLAPLAESLRHEVTRIFHDRIAAAGLTGEIDFATVTQFPVAPLDALREPVGMAV